MAPRPRYTGGCLLSAIVALLCSAASATATTTGYLSAPTDQIAVPGMAAGGEITPEGDLYTGWAEYELRFGRRLAAWNQPTRTLPEPSLPLFSSNLSDGPVRYTQTIFAVAVAGRPVAYETVTAANSASHPQLAQVALAVAYTRGRQIAGAHGLSTGAYRYERPVTGQADGLYYQPGQAFSPAFRYSTAGRDLVRSGLLVARGPARPSAPLGTAAATTSPTAVHDARLFTVRLKAHGRASFTWQIPLSPPPAGPSADAELDGVSSSSAQTELRRAWRLQESGMMDIRVPEAKVGATYRAAITAILASRYLIPSGWVQGTNKLQYQAFWIRDAAIETEALDLAGLHGQAEQNLAFLSAFQRADGLFISRVGQYDGFGQALWALSRHAELSRAPAYASSLLGSVGKAVSWLASVTAIDPLGLLPAGDPRDNELAFGHITGDNLWAAAGLRSAVSIARLARREDLAAAWQAIDRRFEDSLGRAITVARGAGHIPPVLDVAGGQDWGNYYAAHPVQVLTPTSAAVKATVAWERAHMAEGLPTYSDGRSLHDYLGFSVFQTQLAAGDSLAAVAGLYAELVHTTSTFGGWEWNIAPFGTRASAVNLAPHGTFAGDYVALLRNMLVADGPSGVSLLEGASPAWLAPGQRITVTRAPTSRGVISFTERSTAAGETLSWRSNLGAGTPLKWVLPGWARHVRVSNARLSGRAVVLHARAGSVTVTFDGHRPRLSYAGAVAALNSAYVAHHRSRPFVSATG